MCTFRSTFLGLCMIDGHTFTYKAGAIILAVLLHTEAAKSTYAAGCGLRTNHEHAWAVRNDLFYLQECVASALKMTIQKEPSKKSLPVQRSARGPGVQRIHPFLSGGESAESRGVHPSHSSFGTIIVLHLIPTLFSLSSGMK